MSKILKSEVNPTKRAVIDINRACQAKCIFCYHRFTTWDALPGKAQLWSLSWDMVKQQLDNAVQRGNTSVDFTGGEPTLWKDPKSGKSFVDVIKYCIQIGLWPCVISNGLSSPDTFYEIIAAGCKEFLFSIHHVDEKLDTISQIPGHWKKLSTLIKDVMSLKGVMWRANSCINSHNYKELPAIVEWASTNGCKIINFININPPYETDLPHLKELQVPVNESSPYLKKAIDLAYEKNLWINVRYYPMCALQDDEKPGFYEARVCDHPQVMFDPYEWDYGAFPKTPENYLRYGREAFQYKSNAQDGKCGTCGLRNVCGGVNLGYRKAHGEEELTPYCEMSNYVYYFHQKRIGCDIVIPAFRMKSDITRLLNELPFKTTPPYQLHIINKEQNAAGNRQDGINACNEDYIIMCDDDIVDLPDNWNHKLIRHLRDNPNILAVSARLMNKDGTIGMNSANNFNIKDNVVVVEMIPTACCVFRKKDIEGMSFCKDYRGSGWEDTDWFDQLKVKHPGKKIIIDNNIKVVHLNEMKEDMPYFEYNKQVYMKRHNERRTK